MQPIEIFVTVSCTLLAVLGGCWISDRTRTRDRKHRAVDTLIDLIDADISHFSTLDDTASKQVMDFHFQSCLRLRPHLMTVEELNSAKCDDFKEIFSKYNFEIKTKENYESLTRTEKDFPRRVLVGYLTKLKSKLHKLYRDRTPHH